MQRLVGSVGAIGRSLAGGRRSMAESRWLPVSSILLLTAARCLATDTTSCAANPQLQALANPQLKALLDRQSQELPAALAELEQHGRKVRSFLCGFA